MIRTHLRRYGVPRPPCHVTRETSGPTNFRLRGPDIAPHSPYARTPRVACHRAPPRSWTLLKALAGLLRQALVLEDLRRTGHSERGYLGAGATICFVSQ